MLPARHNNWMPDIFNDFFDTNWMDRPKATAPAINVIETPEAYELELAAPGMTKEDFNVHLDEEGDLVINMSAVNSPTPSSSRRCSFLRTRTVKTSPPRWNTVS